MAISVEEQDKRVWGNAISGSVSRYLGVLFLPGTYLSRLLYLSAISTGRTPLVLLSHLSSHRSPHTPRTPNRTVRALKRTCGSYTYVRIITVSGRGLVSETTPSARAYRRDLYQLHAHPSRSQSPSVASTIELVSEIGNRARDVSRRTLDIARACFPRHC